MNTTTPHQSLVQDTEIGSYNGFVALGLQALLTLGLIPPLLMMGGIFGWSAAIALALVSLFCLGGYTILDPNQVCTMTFFGRYVGTLKTNGFRWNNPLYAGQKVSIRVSNFESKELKVNDLDGNPINISAVVVWRVRDAAAAVFTVDDYGDFVGIQTESALRGLASHYSYDSHDQDKKSLRGDQEAVATRLKEEVQALVGLAGLEIIEARLNKLSYAPEIASAMLQRQQAAAVVAARELIVTGAVGMVQMALEQLDKDNIVELDDERKAAMVSNLLVVLCSDRSVSPVVNAGSIHN
jgi:regulator of protease activity HflC (stomatin/prohibitin superfamily)